MSSHVLRVIQQFVQSVTHGICNVKIVEQKMGHSPPISHNTSHALQHGFLSEHSPVPFLQASHSQVGVGGVTGGVQVPANI